MRLFVVLLGMSLFLTLGCKTTQNGGGDNGSSNSNNSSHNDAKRPLIPTEKDNYWVYEIVDGNAEKKTETVKVLKQEQGPGGLKIDLQNSDNWLVRNDTIYVRCQTRGGGEFTRPLYVRCEEPCEYETCLGDVVTPVKAKKLRSPVTIGEETYKNCYEFEYVNTTIVVADGVGIISKKLEDKISNKTIIWTLKEYELEK